MFLGAAAAVEDEVELGRLAVFAGDGVLSLLEDVGPQLDGAGLVRAVHVAKRRGEHVAADAVEALVNGEHVLGRGVKFLRRHVLGSGRAVFLAADNAGLDLEDDLVGGAQLEVFFRDGHVLLERQDGGVEHVALEQVALAVGAPLGRRLDERLEEAGRFLRLAMVGVQADENVVPLGQPVGGLGEHDAAEHGVVVAQAGGELPAAGGHLDDAVGLRVGERLERGVDRGDGGDVDGRIGVVALLGGVQHCGVLLRCCDWHD